MARCSFCRVLTVEKFRTLLPFHDNLTSLKTSAEAGCDFCLLCWRGFQKVWDASLIDSVLQNGSPKGVQDFDPSIWIYGHFEDINPTVSQPQLMLSCGKVAFSNGLPENRNNLGSVDLDFFAKDKSPGALRMPGRLCSKSHEPDLYPLIIKRWLRRCEKWHKCTLEGDVLMPTRLISVGDPANGVSSRLQVLEPGMSENYIALSYCWGSGSNTFTLTHQTMSQLLKGINESDLAAAHQNIISLARSLSIRFVWIDALCIIQGDAQDWEYESQRMAQVYGNATLTVTAGRSDDARNNFLVNDLGQDGHYCEFPLDEEEGSASAFVRLRRSRAHGPIEKRGWCLQEKMLSRRVLVFGEEQLIFWCLKRTEWEDGSSVNQSGSALNFALSAMGGDLNSRRIRSLKLWDSLLIDFSKRHLSNPHDIFAAIASVAGLLSEAMQSRYLAGLWECDLVRGLLWKPGYQISAFFKSATRPQPTRLAPGVVIRAPTWSWAAVQGHVYNPTYDHYQRRKAKWQASDYVKVKPNSRYPSHWSSDPNCEASRLHMPSCELQLIGRLTQASILPRQAGEFYKASKTKLGYPIAWRYHGHLLGRKDVASKPSGPVDSMVALGVFDFASERVEEMWCLQLTAEEGLMLHQAEDGRFSRLGWLYFPDEHWSDDVEELVLSLV